MPIDIASESLLTFSQLASRLPPRRCGRAVHVSTVHRWRSHGIRGVRLEAVRIGGGWVTTLESFTRFCRELTLADDPEAKDGRLSESTNDAVVNAELESEGW